MHDCRSPYFKFDGMRHVLCGAHLLRELAGLMEKGSLQAEEMREFLLDLYKMPHPIAATDEARMHYQVILLMRMLKSLRRSRAFAENLGIPSGAICLIG